MRARFVVATTVALVLDCAAASAAPKAGAPEAASTEAGTCIEIRTAVQLQAMRNNLAGNYCLTKDINAGSLSNFTPVGTLTTPFTGRFDGNGHVIRNLKIASIVIPYVGLFGVVVNAVIQDVGLIDADVSSSATAGPGTNGAVGALVGLVNLATSTKIRRVYSTGVVRCAQDLFGCINGGLVGIVGDAEILDAWSSAAVKGGFGAGGLIGISGGNVVVRNSYATGDVSCSGTECIAVGGFTAQIGMGDLVSDSYATGKVLCPTCRGGGFAAFSFAGGSAVNIYATGAVVAATAGGLIGTHNGTVTSCFAAGPVQGTTAGGLVGNTTGSPTVTDCYWDRNTTGQLTSVGGGTIRTTAQLRAALPAGFPAASWGINRTRSYPFLNIRGFSSNLATVVRANNIYTALPLTQSDESQYIGNPAHADRASLATVYTMAARAIGQTLNVAALDNVKIDKYFWHDATQTTTFTGPVRQHATLSATHAIAPNTPLNLANVIGKLNKQSWVVLRGTYRKPGGATATHYMLATLYTRTGASVEHVIANDPFTGEQVAINPVTKRVVPAASFPLAGFKVNGYAVISNIH